MMDPPKMLLESTFLRAVADRADDHHDRATDVYLQLVQQYEAEQLLLVAVSDHLRRFRSWQHVGPLAPVDELYVGFQHRRAARRVVRLSVNDDLDRALTLVMCERHKVTRLATFDPFFATFDLELTPPAADADAADVDPAEVDAADDANDDGPNDDDPNGCDLAARPDACK
jgi:predicted nucleic acid-binding protein